MDLGVDCMKILKVVLFGLFMLFSTMTFAGLVNINQADAPTLASELKGVGDKKAEAIVDYRTQNDPFKSVDDLQNVIGISVKTIENNRSNLSI